MLSFDTSVSRTILIHVAPGEDLLRELERAAQVHGVRNGVFVSGAGSLSRYHYHVVSSTELPPENAFVEREGAVDILAITGFVLGGRVHAHLTIANDLMAMGGHLEPGCRVLTFAMVALAETRGADMSDWDRVTGRDIRRLR
ncbi:MAG TPA: PPC domain-containing DNA-binding protein [Thermomicrobiales bacterium]|nr:PPC domain-containing DNA-binding protein [Thermomicrobiales bacterium]